MHINDKLAASSLIRVLGLISKVPGGKFFLFPLQSCPFTNRLVQ